MDNPVTDMFGHHASLTEIDQNIAHGKKLALVHDTLAHFPFIARKVATTHNLTDEYIENVFVFFGAARY